MLPNVFYDNELYDVNKKMMDADIYLQNKIYCVDIDLPGFNKNEIHVECHKGNISVKALKDDKESNENKKYIRHERRVRKLERSFYFHDIDEDNIKAEYNNGVLHLEIPEKHDSIKKQITIE